MRKLSILVVVFTLLSFSSYAAGKRVKYSIKETLSFEGSKPSTDLGVKLYWANQKSPKPAKKFGAIKVNKKGSAFNKTDKEACQQVFLKAVADLKQRAKSMGANAVINIKSNYKNKDFISATQFECGAGGLVVGATFTGEAVKIGIPSTGK